MKYLDKNKGKCSIVFFTLCSVIIIPIIMFVEQLEIKVILGLLLAIILGILILYYFKGLADAAMAAAYIVLFSFFTVIGVICKMYVKFPRFIDPNIINAICIFFLIVFTLVIPIPKIIKNVILNKILDETASDGSDDCSSPENKENKATTYKIAAEYRDINNYSKKSYALPNISLAARKIRIFLGIIFFSYGIIALIIGTNYIDDTSNFLKSHTFWFCSTGLCSIVFGAVYFIAGFFRGIFAASIIAALIPIGYFAYKWINLLRGRSIHILSTAIILVITAVIYLYYIFLRFLWRKSFNACSIYEKDGMLYGVDLSYGALIPIEKYDTLLKVVCSFDDKSYGKGIAYLDKKIPDLFQYCGLIKVFLCGYKLTEKNIEIYIYTKSERKQIKRIEKYFSKWRFLSFHIDEIWDKDWDIYNEELYPDKYKIQEMKNLNIYRALEIKKFDFTQEKLIVYTILFENEENALSFKKIAIEKNYSFIDLMDNRKIVEENELYGKYSYSIAICEQSKLGYERLNIASKKIIEMAKSFDGDLLDLYIAELDTFKE